jgi:hypothetical protein
MIINDQGKLIIGRRAANLHESDPYWDEDLGYYLNAKGEYDDEANDTRPNEEKYKNYWGVLILLVLLFIALCFGVYYILEGIDG